MVLQDEKEVGAYPAPSPPGKQSLPQHVGGSASTWGCDWNGSHRPPRLPPARRMSERHCVDPHTAFDESPTS